jgi:cytochrome c peroxidase
MLWFEPRLSSSQILSCNSCHNLAMGGDDNQQTSIGHGWQAGPRNSPTVWNAVFNAAQFWDGRAADLREQAGGPIQASVEMNNQPDKVVETLRSMPEYVEHFQRAFPGEKSPLSFNSILRAIEAFEATLLTPNAPFDRYLRGDANAMSEQQKRGLQTFVNSGCVACHSGVNLGGQQYFPFGVVERPGAEILPPEDKGRFAVTATATDEYVFRAVPLRNVALTAPYFHSGKVWDLGQAVAIMGVSQLGRQLDDREVQDIVAFLHALTGERPTIELPILPARTDGTPLPVVAPPGAQAQQKAGSPR